MGRPWFTALARAFSSAMTVLGAGCVLGLSLLTWNTWFAARPGIVLKPETHYDFIIVGAGTAGCVLAARLSEDPARSVLLLESGPEFGWLASVPLAAPLLQNTVSDWAFRTESQHASQLGLKNHSSAWPRGRGLGGSGQLNYMVHFPGVPSDFDRWEKEGAHGWGYETIRPIMERLTCERPHDLVPRNSSPRISYRILMTGDRLCLPQRTKKCVPKIRLAGGEPTSETLTSAFVDAGKELGGDSSKDQEWAEKGFRRSRSSIWKGRRWSTLESHLRPALGRDNLHVMLNTHVGRVVFSADLGPGTRRAEGVFLTSGAIVLARHEVIISAGAVGSPQLLLLSGLGPKQYLKQFEWIPFVADLPVGHNLHDHLNMPLYVSFSKPNLSLTLSKLRSIRQLGRYLFYKEGLLASTAVSAAAIWPSNLGILLFAMGTPEESVLGNIANYMPETFHGLFPLAKNSSQEGAVLLSSCLQPHSRGTVTLQDSNPLSVPLIDPRYLSEPKDVKCMAQAFKLAARVTKTRAFKRLGAKMHLPEFKHCGKPNLKDDAYLACAIRTSAITGYHPAGTCRMGSGRQSVLTPELLVRGVTGLRVVDSSVFPTPVSGTPNSVLIAVAERTANRLIIEYPTVKYDYFY
ncbi:neither inactivation nor afterpotential protein G-like isoform X1 [Cloeon dipterum]|uniref:neither inactivation nor afterpotential protein G-like isoform X1 n=1 Tax=Cloeon dipterum TaxID=197152 RepID=UPI0032202B30